MTFMNVGGRKVMSVVTAAISKAPGAGCEKGSPSGKSGWTLGLVATTLQPSNSTGLQLHAKYKRADYSLFSTS